VTITREELKLSIEPVHADPSNDEEKWENNSFTLRESVELLAMPPDNVERGVKLGILRSKGDGEEIRISVDSIKDMLEDPFLKLELIGERVVSQAVAEEYLCLDQINIKRLVKVGVLLASVPHRDAPVEAMRFRLRDLEYAKSVLDRVLGGWKHVLADQRAAQEGRTLPDATQEDEPPVPATMNPVVKACKELFHLGFHIEITGDSSLHSLRANVLKTIYERYKGEEGIRVYYIDGDDRIRSCKECLEEARELSEKYNRSLFDFLGNPCRECQVDRDYYSAFRFEYAKFHAAFDVIWRHSEEFHTLAKCE